MNRETFEDDTIFIGDAGWASWALHPSPWAGGCLIVNCEDDPDTPVVAFAPPGVSLYGESGFETARWRRADWSTTAEFIDHLEPSRMITLELVSVYAEVPPDFSDWLARATAAHIERLRSFLADRPGQGEAAELADLLSEEMDQAFPGAFDSYCSESESFSREEPVAASQFSAGPERMSLRGMTRPQAWDLFGQVAAFGLLYVLYRLVREPSAPQGAKVGWNELLSLPVGEFALWLYGFGHFAVPIGFLLWLYFCHHNYFPQVRNAVVIAAAIPVGAYLIYMPNEVYAVTKADSVPASALPTMPALHLVIAIMLGAFGAQLSRTRWARIAWVAYPVFVALLLVVSQSRYTLATIIGALAASAAALYVAKSFAARLRLPFDIPARPSSRPSGEHYEFEEALPSVE